MDHADIFFPRYGKMATISSPLKILLLVLCSVTLCHASSTAETSAATTAAMTTMAATTAAATTTATPVVCKIDNITQADRTETSLTFDFAVSQGGTGHCKDIQICIDPNDGSEHCVNKTGEATGTVIFSGLFSGRLYTVNITVTDSTNGAESLNTAARTYPKPPEQVSVKATTTESITLEFTPPSDTEFNFYLIEYGGVSENISKTTETEITGLQPGNVYDFTVQTVSWGLEGVNSTSVTGLTLPDPPQKPEIISVKETTITVNWSSPVGNHDSVTVSCVGQSGASSNTVTVGNDTREATCTSLTPGALYSVTLVATYGGEQSTNVTADPESAVTIPLAVEDVTSQTLDTSSIVVNFTHPGNRTVSQCSSFVIHYHANHSQDVHNVETACASSENSYSQILTGLDANAFYTINITTRSKPDKDNSTKSSRTQPQTSAWTLPNPTTDLTLSVIGSRWIEMNVPKVSEQPENVAFYALHVSNSTSDPNQCVKQVFLLVSGALTDFPTGGVSCSSNNCPESSSEIYASPYNLTELRPYINHTMTVVVVNPGGCSKPTQPLTSLTSQDVPGPVSTFTAIADAYYIDISWSHPEERNGILTNYTIVRCEKNTTTPDCGEVCQTHTVLPENTTYHIDLLNPAHCYNITIAASTSIGMGPTELIDQSCTKAGKPPTPVEVLPSVDGPYNISVNWTYSSCTKPTGDIQYNVSAKADGNVEQFVIVDGFGNRFTVIPSLRPYVTYKVCVIAFTMDSDDNTLLADEQCGVDVTTEQAASGPVSEFTVEPSGVECYNLNLTWNFPVTPNGLITSYDVEYKKITDATWETKEFPAVGTGSQAGTIECADPNNQEYDLKIIPINGAGRGAITETSGETGVCPPKELTEPSASAGSQSKTSFTVELNKCQLCKNLNGDLTFAGIILSETKESEDQAIKFDNKEAMDAEFRTYDDYDPKVGYRTTPDNWLESLNCDAVTGCGDDLVCQETGRMRRAADTFQFVIGNESSCEPNTYCNKQLGKNKDSRNFRIRLVVGTDGGFYVTKFVDDVFTTDKFMAWIAGPVIASVVVIVAIILLVIFLRKKNIGPFREKQKTRSARLSANDDFSNAFTNQAMALDEPLIEKPLPIDINNFEQYVREHSRDSDLLFAEEYKLIQELAPKHPSEASEHPNNRLKNRFTNILPFDHSRVKLLPADDDDCSDYINANYMPGYNSKREFIASQGPMKSTVEDFWRMIWEQNVAIIVMVTQLEERGRERCAKYWPNDNEPMYYGDLQVQMRSESVLDSYVIRILDVRLGESKRTLTQFHYMLWPDFGVPKDPDNLVQFVLEVRAHVRPNKGAIIIHCSAGVGRTGSFIAVDRLLQHIQDHDTFSVFDVVMEMRNQRCYMIQVEAQYILIHKCILAAIKRGLYRKNNFRQSQPDDPIYANAGFEPPEAIYENAMPHQQVAEGRV